MTDQLDGRIGEVWSGEVPNGSHIDVVLARRGSPTAAAAAGALAAPRPGHPRSSRASSPGVVVLPITIVVNKSPIGDDAGSGRSRGAPRSSASRRACWTRSPRGDRRRRGRRTWSCVAVWVDPAAGDETAVKRGQPRGHARGDRRCARGRPGRGCARSSIAARTRRTELLRRRLTKGRCASRRSRSGATASRSTRRSAPPGTPARGRAARRRWSIVRADDGTAGLRQRRRVARRRAARAPAGRARPAPDRGGARAVRDRRLPRRPAVDRRGGRAGTSPRGRWASRCGGCSAGAPSGSWRTPRAAELVAPDERARRVVALRDAGVRAVKLRFHHADWRDDVAVVEAVRDAVGGDVELMV